MQSRSAVKVEIVWKKRLELLDIVLCVSSSPLLRFITDSIISSYLQKWFSKNNLCVILLCCLYYRNAQGLDMY